MNPPSTHILLRCISEPSHKITHCLGGWNYATFKVMAVLPMEMPGIGRAYPTLQGVVYRETVPQAGFWGPQFDSFTMSPNAVLLS